MAKFAAEVGVSWRRPPQLFSVLALGNRGVGRGDGALALLRLALAQIFAQGAGPARFPLERGTPARLAQTWLRFLAVHRAGKVASAPLAVKPLACQGPTQSCMARPLTGNAAVAQW